MQEELVTFKTAKLAKEVGFNEWVRYCFTDDGKIWDVDKHKNDLGEDVYSAPRLSLLEQWVRETHDLIVLSDAFIKGNKLKYHFFCIDKEDNIDKYEGLSETHTKRKVALNRTLYKILKFIKNEK